MPKSTTTVTETTVYTYADWGKHRDLVKKVKTTVTESEYTLPYATTIVTNARAVGGSGFPPPPPPPLPDLDKFAGRE